MPTVDRRTRLEFKKLIRISQITKVRASFRPRRLGSVGAVRWGSRGLTRVCLQAIHARKIQRAWMRRKRR